MKGRGQIVVRSRGRRAVESNRRVGEGNEEWKNAQEERKLRNESNAVREREKSGYI